MKTKLFRKIVETHGRASLLLVRAGFKPAPYRLLLLLLCPTVGMAQNGITISNFAAAPGKEDAPDTLTFDVQWSPPQPEVVWSDTVWVFVDYNHAGTMTRLPLDPTAATLTRHSATNCPDCGVDRARSTADGVWVVGNARAEGTFSATVRVVGAGLEPAPTDVARHVSTGMCVYAINYPPVGQYTAANQIKFNGTPPFYLSYSGGGAATVTRDAAKEPYPIPEVKTLASFTDASLAPGVTKCKTPAPQTLTASAAGYCKGAAGVQLALANTESGAIYRLWKGDDDAGTVTGNGSAMTFTNQHQKGTYTATVEATAQFCPATLTSRVTVTEVALPVIESVSATTVCAGSPATITAEPLIDNATYTWSACGDTWSTSSNAATVTCSATSSGSVTVKDGCTSAISTYPISVTHPAGDSSPVNACGCMSGATVCDGTCTTAGTHTVQSDVCAGFRVAYLKLVSPCGAVLDENYAGYYKNTCSGSACGDTFWAEEVHEDTYSGYAEWSLWCFGVCHTRGKRYSRYLADGHYSTMHCVCCN